MITTKRSLTEAEENLVKDILKVIGQDAHSNKNMAKAVGLPVEEFDSMADSIFMKMGNGRVTEE